MFGLKYKEEKPYKEKLNKKNVGRNMCDFKGYFKEENFIYISGETKEINSREGFLADFLQKN